MTAPEKRIPLASIDRGGGTQVRESMAPATVDEYAAAIADGAAFPPVVVFFDGKTHWLADGFHRVAAHEKAGVPDVLAEVREGTREDALWFALSANKRHGLPMSNADKQRAVKLALASRPHKSDREIASTVGVDHKTVARVRADMPPPTGELPQLEGKTEGADGKHRSAPGDASDLVRSVLGDPEFAKMSNAAIARELKVSPSTVAKVRKQMAAPPARHAARLPVQVPLFRDTSPARTAPAKAPVVQPSPARCPESDAADDDPDLAARIRSLGTTNRSRVLGLLNDIESSALLPSLATGLSNIERLDARRKIVARLYLLHVFFWALTNAQREGLLAFIGDIADEFRDVTVHDVEGDAAAAESLAMIRELEEFKSERDRLFWSCMVAMQGDDMLALRESDPRMAVDLANLAVIAKSNCPWLLDKIKEKKCSARAAIHVLSLSENFRASYRHPEAHPLPAAFVKAISSEERNGGVGPDWSIMTLEGLEFHVNHLTVSPAKYPDKAHMFGFWLMQAKLGGWVEDVLPELTIRALDDRAKEDEEEDQ